MRLVLDEDHFISMAVLVDRPTRPLKSPFGECRVAARHSLNQNKA